MVGTLKYQIASLDMLVKQMEEMTVLNKRLNDISRFSLKIMCAFATALCVVG